MASFSGLSSSLIILFSLLFTISEAKEILVGGNSYSWSIPTSNETETLLNKWAEKSRFRIGDTLVWKYDGEKDSVLEVSKEDYEACNTSRAMKEYKDGNTKVSLDRAGPFYFISGAKGHCEKGQKLIVVVLSPRRNRFYGISPAPSPAEIDGPAIAPTSGVSSLRSGLVVAFGVLTFWLF
ncbi:early nodulin-like protein 15 [Humulus lupulus]|uniref:early nodulin-like protein 15 n=1 Tax=Humulus lupulus TaxID=3486 RepID=UPI002B417A04|nr:early nodulin-like protein 15 [Humulus lupulus]